MMVIFFDKCVQIYLCVCFEKAFPGKGVLAQVVVLTQLFFWGVGVVGCLFSQGCSTNVA